MLWCRSKMKEQRVLFRKGKQREFFDIVVEKLNCVSVRGILQFGFEINYSSLKNYYSERRLMPLGFFNDLCHLAKIDINKLKIKFIDGNWGQIKGGKKRKV
jgi:hypothetical protein